MFEIEEQRRDLIHCFIEEMGARECGKGMRGIKERNRGSDG
jgi:hypothetical protein